MARDGHRTLIENDQLLRWLKSHGFEQGEYYKFYPMSGTERSERIVVRVKDDNQIEVIFEGRWRSLLDSMDLTTPKDSPEIRARLRNSDPWSD